MSARSFALHSVCSQHVWTPKGIPKSEIVERISIPTNYFLLTTFLSEFFFGLPDSCRFYRLGVSQAQKAKKSGDERPRS